MSDKIPWHYLDIIRDNLWSRKEYGNVGLMVGAGFSRNAEKMSKDTPPFPLWPELGKKMYEEIYPQKKAEQKNRGDWSDAVKMASLYEATFKRAELNRLLHKIIPDKDYFPGKLHKMLLSLPWADIFTTNYDTLLEKTKDFVYERGYQIIKKTENITNSRKPRIVKLHGSLPDTFPLIITEEDYRRYPIDFSPFVNMVQQSLAENMFCLVGFSGEDSNFLNRTGWIRDNFGKNALQIFLIGVFDILEPQKNFSNKEGLCQ